MSFGLEHNEKQKVIGVLRSATNKMIKQLQQDEIVSLLDFYHLCEDAYKDEVWLGIITKLTYKYTDYSFLYVKIKCQYFGSKFKVSFCMGKPHGKFEDQTPIPNNLSVQEIINES